MSGFLDSALVENKLARSDVIVGHPGFLVAALRVQVLRDEDQQVLRDPLTPVAHPCDPAHVQVAGVKANKRRSRFAKQAFWVPGLSPEGALRLLVT
jgi:hypothetical protein